jgi:hypothetical protein
MFRCHSPEKYYPGIEPDSQICKIERYMRNIHESNVVEIVLARSKYFLEKKELIRRQKIPPRIIREKADGTVIFPQKGVGSFGNRL